MKAHALASAVVAPACTVAFLLGCAGCADNDRTYSRTYDDRSGVRTTDRNVTDYYDGESRTDSSYRTARSNEQRFSDGRYNDGGLADGRYADGRPYDGSYDGRYSDARYTDSSRYDRYDNQWQHDRQHSIYRDGVYRDGVYRNNASLTDPRGSDETARRTGGNVIESTGPAWAPNSAYNNESNRNTNANTSDSRYSDETSRRTGGGVVEQASRANNDGVNSNFRPDQSLTQRDTTPRPTSSGTTTSASRSTDSAERSATTLANSESEQAAAANRDQSGSNNRDKQAANNRDQAIVRTASPATAAADSEILAAIMAIDLNEVMLASVARQENLDSQVADYAKMMKRMHGEHLMATMKLSHKMGVEPNCSGSMVEGIEKKGATELNTLAGLDGKDFQNAYVQAMIKGHTDALATIDQQLAKSNIGTEVKQHLTAMRSVVADHLEKAKALPAGSETARTTEPKTPPE